MEGKNKPQRYRGHGEKDVHVISLVIVGENDRFTFILLGIIYDKKNKKGTVVPGRRR